MFSDDILFKLIGLLFVLEILRQTDFFGGISTRWRDWRCHLFLPLHRQKDILINQTGSHKYWTINQYGEWSWWKTTFHSFFFRRQLYYGRRRLQMSNKNSSLSSSVVRGRRIMDQGIDGCDCEMTTPAEQKPTWTTCFKLSPSFLLLLLSLHRWRWWWWVQGTSVNLLREDDGNGEQLKKKNHLSSIHPSEATQV